MEFENVLVGVIFLIIIGTFAFLVWFAVDSEYKNAQILKECFYDINSHTDCKWILYKYENRTKNNTTVVPMPVVVR